MIKGLIPIGGKGTRLGLPFSKEMLPQKNYDCFNPVVNHLVQKMLLAGAETITFVHGLDFKEDVLNYFYQDKFKHILQHKLGFANVLKDFYKSEVLSDNDKVLFGLPDSIFNANPFVEMLNIPGIVCGCFTTEDYSKVDRLDLTRNYFIVKVEKRPDNLDRFWGILKFDTKDLYQMVEDDIFETTSEIGTILNRYKFNTVYGEKYIDIGTWEGYNRYLTSREINDNIEIEKKFDASDVDKEQFFKLFDIKPKVISSIDHYFTVDNPNIEFVRYRQDSKDEGSIPDITIKDYQSSQFNRFELTVPISKQASKQNVIHFLTLLGAKFKFDVKKDCIIFDLENYTIVYYEFVVKDVIKKIIEIELKKGDFNLLSEAENLLVKLNGFNKSYIIKESKFQLVKEIYDSSH